MKILVLGAEGIIGSEIMRAFPDALGTNRTQVQSTARILPGVDITCSADLTKAFDWAEPQAIVNCAGIVKSECDKHSSDRVTHVNAVAPHVIARLAAASGCRVVHLSTDCVFDGTRGGRTEADLPDATDLYGRSKAEGELAEYSHCVTLRTSFIGRDHVYKRGLLEWLLAQTDEAVGYTRAMWSGLSTYELARVIEVALLNTELSGTYHVSGPVISKADLLETLVAAYGLSCRVRRVGEPYLDRSMDGSRFAQATGYVPPTWSNMAQELALDSGSLKISSRVIGYEDT